MRVGEIGFVAPFRYTGLVWALILGLVVFGDWPDALTLAGAAIVVATGLFTLYRERKLARARRRTAGDAAKAEAATPRLLTTHPTPHIRRRIRAAGKPVRLHQSCSGHDPGSPKWAAPIL